jgi:hypothetical protein
MTGTEIYKRTPTYERQAREIRLHAPQWKLLLAYDGQRTLAEVALTAETTFAEALPLTKKFLDEQWIEEQPITLDQFLKRQGMKDIAATGAMVPPAAVLHKPEPEAATPAPTPTPPQIVTPPPAAAATPVPAPPPLPATSAVAKEVAPAVVAASGTKTGRAMKLSAVVDFITSLVGNIGVGQLLVYRVFLRVPPELLLAEDISSVHLAGDTSLIQSENLQQAIADAINAVAKRTLPDSVFVPA